MRSSAGRRPAVDMRMCMCVCVCMCVCMCMCVCCVDSNDMEIGEGALHWCAQHENVSKVTYTYR